SFGRFGAGKGGKHGAGAEQILDARADRIVGPTLAGGDYGNTRSAQCCVFRDLRSVAEASAERGHAGRVKCERTIVRRRKYKGGRGGNRAQGGGRQGRVIGRPGGGG